MGNALTARFLLKHGVEGNVYASGLFLVPKHDVALFQHYASGPHFVPKHKPPSLCIDKGINPGAFPYDKVPDHDFSGVPNSRPRNIPNIGNEEGNIMCDMGAYEVQP